MKRIENRIRTNFHRDKRIRESLSRKYGFEYQHPRAHDTVPALILSARALHADRQSGVSRDNVLQQHISVPHHNPTTPKDVRRLQAARQYNSGMLKTGATLSPHLSRYSDVLGFDVTEDPYLMANIGFSSNSLSSSNHCGDPECGFGWTCDLCEKPILSTHSYEEPPRYSPPKETWEFFDGFTENCFDILDHPTFCPADINREVLSSIDFPYGHLYDAVCHEFAVTPLGRIHRSTLSSSNQEVEAAIDDCTPQRLYCKSVILLSIIASLLLSSSHIMSVKCSSSRFSAYCGGGVPDPLLSGFSRRLFDRGRFYTHGTMA